MITIDLNQFHLEQIFQQVTAIMLCVAGVIAALLALDNAVDMIAKMLGNKEIDTLCGRLAVFLNNLYNKIKPVNVPPVGVPPINNPATNATVATVAPPVPGAPTPVPPSAVPVAPINTVILPAPTDVQPPTIGVKP